MSIINEALKKAQESNKQQINAAADQAPARDAGTPPDAAIYRSSAAPRKDFRRPARAGWLLPVLISAVVISGALVFFKSSFKDASPAVNLPSISSQQTFAPKNASELPVLKLSGIVYDNERPYAIVNDKVLLKGDMIDGATLIEINRESVKFVFNDKEFEISSK